MWIERSCRGFQIQKICFTLYLTIDLLKLSALIPKRLEAGKALGWLVMEFAVC